MTLPEIVQSIQSIFTVLAILGGGIWAYYNFFRGRIYYERLEPSVTGKILSRRGKQYLLVTAYLKNVGLSRVEIEQKGSGLRVLSLNPALDVQNAENSGWEHVVTLPIFAKHMWIESKEEVNDPQVVELPRGAGIAVKLELRIVSKKRLSWSAATIIEVPLPEAEVGAAS